MVRVQLIHQVLNFRFCPATHSFSTCVEIFACYHPIVFKKIVHFLIDVLCLELANIGIFVNDHLTVTRLSLIVLSYIVQVRLLRAWLILISLSVLLLVFFLFLDRLYSQRINFHLLSFLLVPFCHLFSNFCLSYPLFLFSG